MWYKTKYLIRTENNKSDDYDYKYMKLKSIDDNLPKQKKDTYWICF